MRREGLGVVLVGLVCTAILLAEGTAAAIPEAAAASSPGLTGCGGLTLSWDSATSLTAALPRFRLPRGTVFPDAFHLRSGAQQVPLVASQLPASSTVVLVALLAGADTPRTSVEQGLAAAVDLVRALPAETLTGVLVPGSPVSVSVGPDRALAGLQALRPGPAGAEELAVALRALPRARRTDVVLFTDNADALSGGSGLPAVAGVVVHPVPYTPVTAATNATCPGGARRSVLAEVDVLAAELPASYALRLPGDVPAGSSIEVDLPGGSLSAPVPAVPASAMHTGTPAAIPAAAAPPDGGDNDLRLPLAVGFLAALALATGIGRVQQRARRSTPLPSRAPHGRAGAHGPSDPDPVGAGRTPTPSGPHDQEVRPAPATRAPQVGRLPAPTAVAAPAAGVTAQAQATVASAVATPLAPAPMAVTRAGTAARGGDPAPVLISASPGTPLSPVRSLLAAAVVLAILAAVLHVWTAARVYTGNATVLFAPPTGPSPNAATLALDADQLTARYLSYAPSLGVTAQVVQRGLLERRASLERGGLGASFDIAFGGPATGIQYVAPDLRQIAPVLRVTTLARDPGDARAALDQLLVLAGEDLVARQRDTQAPPSTWVTLSVLAPPSVSSAVPGSHPRASLAILLLGVGALVPLLGGRRRDDGTP